MSVEKKIRDLIHLEWGAHAKNEMWDEVLIKNSLFCTIMGRKIGVDSVKNHSCDLFHAFPDFQTRLKNIEVFGNLVICDVEFVASHQNFFLSENSSNDGIIIKSDFCEQFSKLRPSGTKVVQPAELFFVFDQEKIVRISIQEDPLSLYRQLGLHVETEKPCQKSSLLRERNFLIKKLQDCFEVLSMKEITCLALAFSGFSAKFVAAILGVSFRTVESHWFHSYQKLDCNGKQQCLEMVMERGILYLFHELSMVCLKLAEK